MKISRAAIKRNAKYVISTAKPSPILVGLAYLGIILILQLLTYKASGMYSVYEKMMEEMMAGNMDYVPPAVSLSTGAWVIIAAILLVRIMIDTGFVIYCLDICSFRKAGFGNLFDGSAVFFRVLWLDIMMIVFIWLWSLLFIIPGIIAAYRYRMALYIMLENPHMSAFDCIRASSEMMRGHKAELFVLDLSMLGWYILAMFPFVPIWVVPYAAVTYTNYYIALRNMPEPAA